MSCECVIKKKTFVIGDAFSGIVNLRKRVNNVWSYYPILDGDMIEAHFPAADPSFPCVLTSDGYDFVVISANATQGAIYSNNGEQFTVESTVSAGTLLQMQKGTGAPQASGVLTLVSGTGDATIAFSSVNSQIVVLDSVAAAIQFNGLPNDSDLWLQGTNQPLSVKVIRAGIPQTFFKNCLNLLVDPNP